MKASYRGGPCGRVSTRSIRPPAAERPMHLERMTPAESRTIGEVLRAASDGPFFPDWEFSTLFGLTREEVRSVADAWPVPLVPPDIVERAVNNALNMMLFYPHRKWDEWPAWVDAEPADLVAFFARLRPDVRPGRTAAERCFRSMM